MVFSVLFASLTLALGQPGVDSEAPSGPEPSSIQAFLDAFPQRAEIPGARVIVRRGHRSAKHCLVHVRDYHETPGMSAKSGVVVKAVQKDIRDILESFMNHPSIRLESVYAEGVTAENEALHNAIGSTRREDSAPRAGERSITSILAKAFRSGREGRLGRRVEYSAAHQLRQDSGLTLKAAETAAANRAASAALRDRSAKGARTRSQRVLDDREDVLLRRIVENGDEIAVTVYGGFHDWSNNIRAWNRRHPNETFCLIQITPAAYHSYEIHGRAPRD